MSQANMRLHPREKYLFNATIHMFPTNNLVSFHNRHMIKSLISQIARCVVEHSRHLEMSVVADDQLDHEVLLCHGQHVMLKCNVWVQVDLVNSALGYVKDIFYPPTSKQTQLPMFTTVVFDKYVDVPFDASNANLSLSHE